MIDGNAHNYMFGEDKGNSPSGAGAADEVAERLTAYQRRKRLQDIRNPYLRAIVAESRKTAGDAADGDLSDLEDFIVTNPERDYGEFIADHFPMAPDDSDEEPDDSEEEEMGGGGRQEDARYRGSNKSPY